MKKPSRTLPVLVTECCPPATHRRPRVAGQYVPLFKALGDETRIAIVALLAAVKGEICVCDIERHFELSQATISHHLKVLKDAGLVRGERRGTWVYYELDRQVLSLVEEAHGLLTK